MRNVFVVVHAESRHHNEGLVGGWYDSELSVAGREQALQVAAEVGRSAPVGAPSRVHSSDLRRAVQTAEPIASALNADLVELHELRELSYGIAEAVQERGSTLASSRRLPTTDSTTDSGIEGAETKRQLAERVYEAVGSILADDFEQQVIVTHGFALTFVVMAWCRTPIGAVGWVNLRSSPDGITHLVEDDSSRTAPCEAERDCAPRHLEPSRMRRSSGPRLGSPAPGCSAAAA
jgi:probable phosphoglycerate mutase